MRPQIPRLQVVLLVACAPFLCSACFDLTEGQLGGPRLMWASSAGGDFGDEAAGVVCLEDAATAITGSYEDKIVFAPGSPQERELSAWNDRDFFIAKYSADGTLVWAIDAGSAGDDETTRIAALPDYGLLVTGWFDESWACDGISLDSTGGSDAFIALYDVEDAALKWAAQGGGAGHDEGQAILAMNEGASLAIGAFSQTATFADAEGWFDGGVDAGVDAGDDASPETLEHEMDPGCLGRYVIRYDSLGGIGGLTQAYQDDGCVVTSSVDSHKIPGNGPVAIAGTFEEELWFEGISPELVSAGAKDVFLAGFEPDNSSWQWHAQGSGLGQDQTHGLAFLDKDSIIVVGSFEETAEFGDHSVSVSSGTASDGFVARYDIGSGWAWAIRFGGGGMDEALGVAVSDEQGANDRFLICGLFSKTATFGSPGGVNADLVSAGGADAFVAEFDAEGNLLWVHRAGGEGDDIATAVTYAGNLSAVATGTFQRTVTFGKDGPNEVEITSAGNSDVFLMRLKWD